MLIREVRKEGKFSGTTAAGTGGTVVVTGAAGHAAHPMN
jgi:hypothetical protein